MFHAYVASFVYVLSTSKMVYFYFRRPKVVVLDSGTFRLVEWSLVKIFMRQRREKFWKKQGSTSNPAHF